MKPDGIDADRGLELDLAATPLSFPGSWLSVSRVVGLDMVADDPHIVSHRLGPQAVLRLTPQLNGAPVPALLRATPDGLTWTHGEATIQLTFDGPSGLRIRGAGLGLRLGAVDTDLTAFRGTFAFSDPGRGWVFSSYGTGFRYLVAPLSGHGRLIGDQALGRAERAVVLPDNGDPFWEVDVREARSGSPSTPTAPASMDELRRSNRSRFDAFRREFGPMRDHPAGDLAAYVLWSSLVGAEGFIRRPAMLMSKNWMDKVWAWDPCFNAVALARAHPELAWDQFLVVFDHQDPATGALPDSVTHSEVLFNFVKPPIHGWALRELRALLPQPLSERRLTTAYTCLSRWTRYWLDCRRAPGHVLPYYEHGNDSGWDNATTFDLDRVIESPDLASFLVIQLDVLAEMAAELGLGQGEQGMWEDAREGVTRALVDDLWDGEQFVAKAVHSRRPSTASSLLNLLPIVIADRLPPDITQALTRQLSRHLTPWGLASESPESARYEPDGYWRGPIWAPATVLVEYGLRRAGREDFARSVRERFLSLCERSAFAENFDALAGTGLRDRAYTWTASSYILYADDRPRPAEVPAVHVGNPE